MSLMSVSKTVAARLEGATLQAFTCEMEIRWKCQIYEKCQIQFGNFTEFNIEACMKLNVDLEY